MSLVDERCNEALDAMTGQQRLERAFGPHDAVRQTLKLSVHRDHPRLSERQVALHVARIMSLSDPRAAAGQAPGSGWMSCAPPGENPGLEEL